MPSYYVSHSTMQGPQKPKKLWEFSQFPTPPSTLGTFPFGGRPTKIWGIPNTHIFLTKFLPLQKKLWQSQIHRVDLERFLLARRVLGSIKRATVPRTKSQKSIGVRGDKIIRQVFFFVLIYFYLT